MKLIYKIAFWIGKIIKAVKLGYRDGYSHSVKIDHIARIKELIKADPINNFVPAIKEYRNVFGATLKDAKNAVEAMRNENS